MLIIYSFEAFIKASDTLAVEASAKSFLEQGKKHYNDLKYEEAIRELQNALARTKEEKDKIEVYKYLAFAYVAQIREDMDKSSKNQLRREAKDNFQKILKIDKGYQFDKPVSPKISKLFEEAENEMNSRQKWYKKPWVIIIGGTAVVVGIHGLIWWLKNGGEETANIDFAIEF